jgi:sugar lactone lactonase YvrE
LHNKTLFASPVLIADSMCVDAGGNVYVASLSGITVLDPKGKQLGVIATNGQTPTNCAFGGPDQRTFFITARVLAAVPAPGNSTLLRIDDMPIPGIPGQN